MKQPPKGPLYVVFWNQKLFSEYNGPWIYLSGIIPIWHVTVSNNDTDRTQISAIPNMGSFTRVDFIHCNDVIMSAMVSQTTSLTIVYSTVYSGADQRKHQIAASLAFVRGIHRWPVNVPHKGPVTRKMFPFNDVIMLRVFGRVQWWYGRSVEPHRHAVLQQDDNGAFHRNSLHHYVSYYVFNVRLTEVDRKSGDGLRIMNHTHYIPYNMSFSVVVVSSDLLDSTV